MSNEHLYACTAVVQISMSPRKQSALGVGEIYHHFLNYIIIVSKDLRFCSE